jgi:hypothetical protein
MLGVRFIHDRFDDDVVHSCDASLVATVAALRRG